MGGIRDPRNGLANSLLFGMNDLCSGEMPFCAKRGQLATLCATTMQPLFVLNGGHAAEVDYPMLEMLWPYSRQLVSVNANWDMHPSLCNSA